MRRGGGLPWGLEPPWGLGPPWGQGPPWGLGYPWGQGPPWGWGAALAHILGPYTKISLILVCEGMRGGRQPAPGAGTTLGQGPS